MRPSHGRDAIHCVRRTGGTRSCASGRPRTRSTRAALGAWRTVGGRLLHLGPLRTSLRSVRQSQGGQSLRQPSMDISIDTAEIDSQHRVAYGQVTGDCREIRIIRFHRSSIHCSHIHFLKSEKQMEFERPTEVTEKSLKLDMHMTQPVVISQPIAILSRGNYRIRHNPLCLVESPAYPVHWISN